MWGPVVASMKHITLRTMEGGFRKEIVETGPQGLESHARTSPSMRRCGYKLWGGSAWVLLDSWSPQPSDAGECKWDTEQDHKGPTSESCTRKYE